ncbi:MAG: hypothetical protein NTZ78_06320 [Candidatus Aureabacteria bacterium]|nr:hypothetical protein [Candidatus Auribacterota bacterium]
MEIRRYPFRPSENRKRTIAACALTIGIVLLCIYSGMYHPGVMLDDCIGDPSRYDGVVVFSPHEATVGKITEGGFLLRWQGQEIQVRGNAPGLAAGEYIGVRGVFHREGYVEALSIHVGRYRRTKMLVSVLGAAIVLSLLWKNLRWSSAQSGFQEIRHPK